MGYNCTNSANYLVILPKLNTMTLIELKASAYDCLAQIEYLQKQLQEINAKINEKLKNDESNLD